MTSKEKTLPLFVIDRAPTIKWPVIVGIPVDGGEIARFQFTGVFRHLAEEQYDEILKSGQTALAAPTTEAKAVSDNSRSDVLRENAVLLPQVLVGWEGVRDTTGEVQFTPETLRQQIVGVNGSYLSAGLWLALAEIRSGARLGN